ncbi:MAG: DUF7706 family protein [Acidiferrobacter sp.]
MTRMPGGRYLILRIEATENEARSFPQFLKRAGLTHYRSLAVHDDEAYGMQAVAECLRETLASSGFAPR